MSLSPLFSGEDLIMYSIFDDKLDVDFYKEKISHFFSEQVSKELVCYADRSERDSYGEKVVDKIHLIFYKVFDYNYFSIEEVKNFHLIDKKSNFYASNIKFYRLFATSCISKNRGFSSWQQVFLYHMMNPVFRLKISFGYAFGLPFKFFPQQIETNEGFIANDFKRIYYSNIPSLAHIYRIFPLEELKKTILDTDLNFIRDEKNILNLILMECNKINSFERQGLVQRETSRWFDFQFDNVVLKKDELSKNRYYMSLVLGLPELIKDCGSFAKSYWYHILLRFPTFYRNAGFVLLYEQLRKNAAVGKSDNIDYQYINLMFFAFRNQCKKMNKFDIFSLRFFAHFALDRIRENFMNNEMHIYCLDVFHSNDTHNQTKYMIVLDLTRYFFEKSDSILVDQNIFDIFDKYALSGLDSMIFNHDYQLWFRYFRKILWLRYCLDTDQNVSYENFIDTNFINEVINHIAPKYKNFYWDLWKQCINKYLLKSE